MPQRTNPDASRVRFVALRPQSLGYDGQNMSLYRCDLCSNTKPFSLTAMAKWDWINACDEHLSIVRKIQALALVANALPRV